MADETKSLANLVFALGLAVVLAGGTIVAVSATSPTSSPSASPSASATAAPSPALTEVAPVLQPSPAGEQLATTGETPLGTAVGEVLGAAGLVCMLAGMVMLSRRAV